MGGFEKGVKGGPGTGSGRLRRLLLSDFEINLAQFLERAVGADLDGSDRAIEEAGDFLVFEMLQAGEHQDLALFQGQAGEGEAQMHHLLGGGRLFGRRGFVIRLVMQVGRISGGGGGGVLAEVIGGHLARQVVDPRGEFTFVAVGVPVFENAVEDNLHQVLAGGRLVGQAHEKPVQAPVVALEEFTKLPDFSGTHGDHEFMVGGGFHDGGEANRGGSGVNSELRDRGEEHGKWSWAVCGREYRPGPERLQGFGEKDWRRAANRQCCGEPRPRLLLNCPTKTLIHAGGVICYLETRAGQNRRFTLFSTVMPPRLFLTAGLLLAGAGLILGSQPITPVPAAAGRRVATVQVRVAPDHRDWSYQLGESVKFKVTVTADNEPIDGVSVKYKIGPDLMPAEGKTAMVPLEGLVIDGGTMTQPGFLRCGVTTEVAGTLYRGTATAAFVPEKIAAMQTEPADFDAFWQAQKAELAKVPLEPRLTLLPDSCTDKVNVYHVSFRNVGPNWTAVPSRIYGILCEPKAPGKYPAVLRVPGAGVRPYFGDRDLAARGVITLEIGVHGIPVNLAQSVYDSLGSGALNGYWLFNFDSKETFYFHRIYLGCVRANDFLTAREIWNGKDLIVMGASQGGQLSIVTAALDPRVTGLSATHPAFCDVAAELHGRAGGWPHPFMPDPATGQPSRQATPAKIETATYYDTVNFARRLKVPGFYMWGYNDETCPPTSTFAAYNVIRAPKELAVELEQGHSYPPEQGAAINDWVVKFLGLP
jgi:cephalosporin-C deacetylase